MKILLALIAIELLPNAIIAFRKLKPLQSVEQELLKHVGYSPEECGRDK